MYNVNRNTYSKFSYLGLYLLIKYIGFDVSKTKLKTDSVVFVNEIACVLALLLNMEAHFKFTFFNRNKVPSAFPSKSHEFIGNAREKSAYQKNMLPGFISFFQMLLKSVF